MQHDKTALMPRKYSMRLDARQLHSMRVGFDSNICRTTWNIFLMFSGPGYFGIDILREPDFSVCREI